MKASRTGALHDVRRGLPRPIRTRVGCCVAEVRARLALLGHLAECPAVSGPWSDHALHHLNADCPTDGDRKALPQLWLLVGEVHPIMSRIYVTYGLESSRVRSPEEEDPEPLKTKHPARRGAITGWSLAYRSCTRTLANPLIRIKALGPTTACASSPRCPGSTGVTGPRAGDAAAISDAGHRRHRADEDVMPSASLHFWREEQKTCSPRRRLSLP